MYLPKGMDQLFLFSMNHFCVRKFLFKLGAFRIQSFCLTVFHGPEMELI